MIRRGFVVFGALVFLATWVGVLQGQESDGPSSLVDRLNALRKGWSNRGPDAAADRSPRVAIRPTSCRASSWGTEAVSLQT